MTAKNKKLKEITENDLERGKYFAVGRPIVLTTNHDHDYNNCVFESAEDEESKFQKSLEDAIGTVQIPFEAEFFIRGHTRIWAGIDNEKKKYIDERYTPVQFYGTAQIISKVVLREARPNYNVSDRDCDRNVAGISNAD